MHDKSFEVMPTLTERIDELTLLRANDFPGLKESIGVEKDGNRITIYDKETLDEDGMPQILMKSDANGQIYYQADLNPERQKKVKNALRREAGFNNRLDETILSEEIEERREGLPIQEENRNQPSIKN